MGVAIKVIGFQALPHLGQITTNGGEDIPLTGLSISGPNVIPVNTPSIQLSVVYTPSNTIQKGVDWTSSNSSVATVSSTGVVTVVNRPSTDTAVIITATSQRNKSIKATYSVTVNKEGEGGGNIPLAGLSISGPNVIPASTSSIQLYEVYTPSNTIQKGVDWTSSNPSVASVSSTGVVTVVNRPSTDTAVIITATSSYNKSIKATYSVTVNKEGEGGGDIPLTGLSISGPSINYIPTNISQVQLLVSYTPSDTTQKGVDWTSSNPSVASVNSEGVVTVVNRPSTDTAVIITATSQHNKSIKATYSTTVNKKEGDIPLVGLSISGTHTIPVNTSYIRLYEAYTPSDTTQKGVNWTSSNPSVATVSSGVVTVVKRLNTNTEVIITATSQHNESIKATYSVIVEREDIPLTGLSISGPNVIPVNTPSIQLSVVYTPSNTIQKGVDWTSSNSSVATVSSTGVVTVVNRPSTDTDVIITATSQYNSIKATHSIKVSSSSEQPASYITDGLVQYYDAIDNQGRNSERISGDVTLGESWIDVISGNNMVLSPSDVRNNIGSFDEKSYNLLKFSNAENMGFSSMNGWPFANVGAGDFTVECTMTTPSKLIDGHNGFSSGYGSESDRYRFQVGITPSGALKFNYRTKAGSWQEKYFTRDSVIKTSTFCNLAIVRRNGVVTVYVNGEAIGTAVDFSAKIFSSMTYGRWAIADNGQPAAYHAYRFYNRALPQNELYQNVNYDTLRYKS